MKIIPALIGLVLLALVAVPTVAQIGPGNIYCLLTGCTYTGPVLFGNNAVSGSNFAITGGSINGTTLGATTPSTAAVTTLSASGAVSGAGFTALLPIAGITGSLGGSALAAGACSTTSVSIAGATTSMAVAVSPSGGTNPGAGAFWSGYVSTTGTVAVEVCAAIAMTPTATPYAVRVIR